MQPAELIVRDAKAWNRWLSQHHKETSGLWLVLAKKGTLTPTTLTHDQALEEAIAHGWIDSKDKLTDRLDCVRHAGEPCDETQSG